VRLSATIQVTEVLYLQFCIVGPYLTVTIALLYNFIIAILNTDTRLAKLKFRKSGGFYQKTGVYQENFFYNSGEKSGGFLFEVKGTLGGFLDYIHLIS